MIIRKSILHIMDFNSDVCAFSQKELDFSNVSVAEFLEKHITKSMADGSQKRGQFKENSRFKENLDKFRLGEMDFTEFSTLTAQATYDKLSKSDELDSNDLIFVEFTEEDVLYIALLLMKNQTAYTHQIVNDGGAIRTEIINHYAILPGVTQKVSSFAIVNCQDYSVGFVDKKIEVDGEDVCVLPDFVLQCSSTVSAAEAVKIVKKIANAVAEEHGANSTIAVSKAKSYLVENSETSDTFSPEELGQQVFGDSEIMKSEFRTKIMEAELPHEVRLERPVALRAGKNHKIKTDTGIEITFPAEYFENPEYIEFINNPDGTISIQLRNIGKIINR